MRISHFHIILLVATAVALSVYLLYAIGRQEPTQCLSNTESKQFEGSYARKETWDKLPLIKEWAKSGAGGASWIDAVRVTSSGESEGVYGWHEGGSVCIKYKDGQLWAKFRDIPPNPPEEWQGPFVFLGKKVSTEDAYFDRIFQGLCYDSDKGEKWCFGSNSIQIGDTKHLALLFPDQSEMPDYGTPVTVDGHDDFLMFVPFGGGWKVFKDTFASEEGHVDIDPNKSPPWTILTPHKSEGAMANPSINTDAAR